MNRYGYDGQLGCAAITFTTANGSSSSDAVEREVTSQLERWLTNNPSAALPPYAVPRFLRVLVSTEPRPAELKKSDEGEGGSKSDTTGADRVSLIMKKLKTELRQDGKYELSWLWLYPPELRFCNCIYMFD